jgi:hypothetical protein
LYYFNHYHHHHHHYHHHDDQTHHYHHHHHHYRWFGAPVRSRHETYSNQFRAMFVHNCIVDRSETLVFRKKERKQKRAKGNQQPRGAANSDEEYFPVVCGECNAVVAVYDHDEVYHVSHTQSDMPRHIELVMFVPMGWCAGRFFGVVEV